MKNIVNVEKEIDKMQRVDDISRFYKPIECIGKATAMLFWVIAVVSLAMHYTGSIFGTVGYEIFKIIFLVLTIIQLVFSQVSRFYLVPRAERMRRRQLLSDAFGTCLTNDRTVLYYNNNYLPSIERLGANTMENALFSKEIAAKMLKPKRLTFLCYFSLWFLLITLRQSNLETVTWITQLVFSGEILIGWLKLEILRFRYEQTYEQLHMHFLQRIGDAQPTAIANILDAFVSYESAKSSAGTLLSSNIFKELNPILTNKWEQIKKDLKMAN